jgi:hypothetical protein
LARLFYVQLSSQNQNQAEFLELSEYISAIIRCMDSSDKDVLPEIANPVGQHNVPIGHVHGANDPICDGPASEKTICGFQKATFCLLAALIIAVVTAAVAAGVGGSIAASKSRQAQDLQNQLAAFRSSSLPSPSPSSCSPASSSSSSSPLTLTGPVASSVSYVDIDCPAIHGNPYYSFYGPVFTTYCSTDYANGGPSANGNGTVRDIIALIAYSINDCMEMCVGYNRWNSYEPGERCAAVSFVADFRQWLSVFSGNCFLKSQVGFQNTLSGVASAAITVP